MRRFAGFVLLAFLAAFPLAGEPRWRLQFFHDEDESNLVLQDLVFPTELRGIACGTRIDKGRRKPVVLLTGDGGKQWQLVNVKESCRSLFFLDEKLGWMAGESGIWESQDSGRTWKRTKKMDGLLRIRFVDRKRGWAVGVPKAIWETSDGGLNWTPVKAAEEPKSSAQYTAYTWVEFVGPRIGMIVGVSRPPRRGESRQMPSWMEPEKADRRREWPGLSIFLETRDGGATWKSSTTSMFGQVTRLRLTADMRGLALVEFQDSFEWPSEVFTIDLRTGKSGRAFRRKDRAVTDVLQVPNGPAYLGAIEPAGTLRSSPIPGKIKILKLEGPEWKEMPVDYRAFGRRVTLAGAGNKVWAATDTGMILCLADE